MDNGEFYKMIDLNNLDLDDPKTWPEYIMFNCYKLYMATELWELDDPMPFDKFKESMFKYENFRQLHSPIEGMDKEDYNPWKLKNS